MQLVIMCSYDLLVNTLRRVQIFVMFQQNLFFKTSDKRNIKIETVTKASYLLDHNLAMCENKNYSKKLTKTPRSKLYSVLTLPI